MALDIASGILAGLVGISVGIAAMFRYFWSHISPQEAQAIFEKAKTIIDDYKKAKQGGNLTTEEKLKIAEDALATLQEIISALQTPAEQRQ